MNTWSSYSLQDFIPYTVDIYLRLLERMSEIYWPLHLLSLILGLVIFWLALKGHARLASILIAPVWGFVAIAFFIQLYAELNWAGGYIAYAFLSQAVLLLLLALTGLGLDDKPHKRFSTIVGIGIALAGLIGLPFIGPLSGGSWFQAETFGIHADPTSMTTLGLAIIMFRGWGLWLITVIPGLWLLYSGLSLWALGIPAAALLFVVLAIGLFGVVWKSTEARFI